jgi:iron complex outermembrane recepter protein
LKLLTFSLLGLLVKTTIQAQSVAVTGTFTPAPLDELDRSVRQLPVDAATRLLSSSWNDLLRLDTSLDLQQRGSSGVLTDLSIRGGNFGQTLVLLNGIRANDSQTGHFNMNVPVPIDAFDRIEVLKGTGSLFYGSDAVGGVVNVITGFPETSTFRLRTAFGNFGTQQQRADFAIAGTKWSQRLVASRDFSTGFMSNRDYRNLSTSSESHLRTSLGNTSVLLAYADRPFGAENFYGNYPSWERTKNWWASIRQELGSRTEASFAFRRNTDLFVLYRYQPERYTNHHMGESYQAALRRNDPLSRTISLHYGIEGLRDQLNSTNLGIRTRDRGAAYFGIDGRALNRFSFTAGGREEIYTGGGRQFSPTVAGAYWFSRFAKLRASISHAFRMPTFTDLYYSDPANVGNPNLKAEYAWTYEGGLDWNAGANLRGNVTVFQRRESNGIDYVRSSPTDVWRATNFNQLHFTGVETAIAWRWRRQQFNAGYTWLHGIQGALDGMQSKYIFNYPTGNTMVGWQGELPWKLIARARISRIDRVQRGPYTVVDAYFARQSARISPFLQLTNLTNARFEEIPAVPVPTRGIIGGVELRLWH